MTRTKKRIPEMMPVKKWLSTSEACAYLDMSLQKFSKVIIEAKLSITSIGVTRYYKVAELDNLLESNISHKQTA